LFGANLSDAKLSGADFREAKVEGAITSRGQFLGKRPAAAFKAKEQRPWWQFWTS
jgi:uncharacterized protein YjbI with pentapeptide repeats